MSSTSRSGAIPALSLRKRNRNEQLGAQVGRLTSEKLEAQLNSVLFIKQMIFVWHMFRGVVRTFDTKKCTKPKDDPESREFEMLEPQITREICF